MADDEKGEIVHESNQGMSAEHPQKTRAELFVAPSNSKKETLNTAKLEREIVACWKIGDICFDFDRAFVRQDAKDEFEELVNLYKEIVGRFKWYSGYQDSPKPPITIFGHADPVGKDDYNKKLSEDRAKAVYGVLTRNISAWEEIYGDDRENIKYLQNKLASLGYEPGPVNGVIGPETKKAILSYMDYLCTFKDESGGDFKFKLEDSDFLGDGEYAYQGCSEFNPLRMFSKEQNDYFKDKEHREERDAENQINRRVVAFLFKPKTRVNPESWPCRSSKEGLEACKKRFCSDWEERRQFQEEGREYKPDEKKKGGEKKDEGQQGKWKYKAAGDSFACRFYERLACLSPCERAMRVIPVQLVLEMYVFDHQYARVAVKYQIAKSGAVIAQGGFGEKWELSEGGWRRKFTTKPMHKGKYKKYKYEDEILEVIEKRLQVMKKAKKGFIMTAGGPVHSDEMPLADNIGYHEDFYPTEHQFMSYAVYTDPKEFQKVRNSERKKSGPGSDKKLSLGQNRIIILWNEKERKVTKYILDGEELDAENYDDSAKLKT